ncbi:hypothetical protein Gpo141_00002520 [Globisporangium polare]
MVIVQSASSTEVAALSPRNSDVRPQSTTHVSLVEKLQKLNATLFLTKKLLFVVFLFALDIRDIVYKVVWIGPMDSYSFVSGSTSILHPVPLVSMITPELRALDAGEHVASGWSSFQSQCDELFAFVTDGSTLFFSALAKNCKIPVTSSSNNTTMMRVIPQLVLTSNIRADAPIWASCELLHIGRRPPICQDLITAHFNDRYAFFFATVVNSDVAPIGSEAETEILRFLDMLSTSIPMHRVICVEAFELAPGQTGTFIATIYGCASPNLYRSEFVGFGAKSYHKLLHGKGWLTNDDIALLGQRFGIRQNDMSDYTIVHSVERNETSIRSYTATNFSSNGSLYALMVAIDIFLLLTHCHSFLEIAKWMFFPKYRELQRWIRDFETSESDKMVIPEQFQKQLRQHEPPVDKTSPRRPHHQQHKSTEDSLVFREERFYSFFCASYYKSPSYMWLTRLARVISWIIILPNSVVWTWSNSQNEKVQAYLSSIKSWVLISSVVQILWKMVVRVMENRAYQFARGTFITNPEIIIIGAIAAVHLQDEIFLMCEKKWAVENQRVNDATSFAGGYIAHGNTFQTANDYRSTTPLEVLRILYDPLMHIILLSVAMIILWLLAKFAYFYALACVSSKGKRSNAIVVDTANLSEASSSSSEGGHHHPRTQSDTSVTTTGEVYARLPLEEVLDIPIRANSLVRYGLSMEIVRDGKRYIRPSCYLDYGIMLKHGERRPYSVSVAAIFKHKATIGEFASMAEAIASSHSVVRSRKFFSEASTSSLLEAAVPLGQDTLVRRAGSASPAQAANGMISSMIRESDGVDEKDS